MYRLGYPNREVERSFNRFAEKLCARQSAEFGIDKVCELTLVREGRRIFMQLVRNLRLSADYRGGPHGAVPELPICCCSV